MSNPAYILNALALDAGLTIAEISSDDVTALALLISDGSPQLGPDCGIWIYGDQTFLQAMDEVAQSVGAWFGFDENGVLRMGRLDNESSGVAATIDESQWQTMQWAARPDKDLGRPSWRVSLDYSKNYTVQRTDIAGVVPGSNGIPSPDDSRRAWLAEEFRTIAIEEGTIHYWLHPPLPNIRVRCLMATEPHFKSLLINEVDAQREVQRLWEIYAVKHKIIDVTVPKQWWIDNGPLNLMDTIRMVWPTTRLNGASNLNYRLIGVRFQLALAQVTMSLWSIETSGP